MEDKFSQAYSNVSQAYGTYAKKIEIPSGIPIIMRVVGDRNDFAAYLESWILCDDGVKRPFIIKNEQGKSLLYDLIGDKDNFYRGGFLESIKDPKTNKPKYIWQMKDPELFNLMMYNNNLSGAGGSWKARPNYAFNAILRNNTAEEGKLFNWCEENKHTMLFILNPTGFKSLGDLIQMSGKLSEYDIAYLKTGTGFDTKHTIYKATPDDTGKNPEFAIAVIGPLTEEELYYGKYSLAKETELKPASTILGKLGDTIERLSSVMGQDWIGKIQKEASYEDKEQSAGASMTHTSYAAAEATKDEAEPAWVSEGTTPAPVQAEPAPVQVAPAHADAVVAEVKPVRVTRVPVEANVTAPGGEMEECYMCQEQIPAGSDVCPKCHNVLMDPCTACGKPFHVSLDVCPHCGKTYKLASDVKAE
jgi:hypothetical protein